MTAVYSPSQTKLWLECPMKRYLRYSLGWRPRRIGKPDLTAILGRAFHAGVALYHARRQAAQPHALAPTELQEIAEASAAAATFEASRQLARLQDQGFVVNDWDAPTAQALPLRVAKGVTRYVLADPLPAAWTIRAVEHTLEEYGNARLDLAIEDADGPAIADVKVKLTLDAKYRAKELSRYQDDHQQLHYAWAWSEIRQASVNRYYIVLVVLEPKWSVEILPYQIHPETMQAWTQSQLVTWHDMAEEDAGTREPYMAATHWSAYGDCEMRKACFEHHWDPQLMAQDYVNTREGKE